MASAVSVLAFKGVNVNGNTRDVQIGGEGADIKAPSSYNVKYSEVDLDDARSYSGVLTRNVVRSGESSVRTIELSWVRLTWEEIRLLIQASNEKKFQISFLSPRTIEAYETAWVYRDANMTYELKQILDDEEAYWSCSMSLVEY